MKRLVVIALAFVLGITLLISPTPALADASINFDSYASGTFAEDVSVAGITFDGGGDWIVEESFFNSLTGQMLYQPVGPADPLTISFSQPHNYFSMNFATLLPENFWVTGYLDGVFQFQYAYVGGGPGFFPEGFAANGGELFDELVIQADTAIAAIDNLYFTAPLNYRNAGEILISANAPVVPYAAPGEYAQLFTLPADYDGNGFDTYIVTGTVTLNGETWYSIFIGGHDYVWVKASQVQVLR